MICVCMCVDCCRDRSLFECSESSTPDGHTGNEPFLRRPECGNQADRFRLPLVPRSCGAPVFAVMLAEPEYFLFRPLALLAGVATAASPENGP